ncbi:putative Xaa-Pro aminopeptidase [Pseudovirgaria hyperparasitica]|uniref:Xaa-Pro aminopeptidase n=1 Tax=Pseudovirgaria hyperparasitica TaxID=470096 RepID=A0A6A6WLT5_9PEZI|nr:putative Xaa-Pro aminopeptidase [Pseudovirgaria hyperparasitica]KAF2763133.1 putative Xaa-Pro aminopeptidase [Pseudovirgaria hyperparasitica]
MAINESILKGKYPAKAHAQKVATYIKSKGGESNGVIYLEAQRTRMNEDNDQAAPFRQRRYFFYLTGCDLPDCHLTYDMATDKSTLFIPPVDPDEVTWSGLPLSPEQALEKYDVDECLTTQQVMEKLASLKGTAYAIENQVSDNVSFISSSSSNFTDLKSAIEECRVTKDAYEIALMRHANEVSTAAHTGVFRAAKTAKNEQELEALFIASCISRGCKKLAYEPIVAAGTAAATLHYIANDQPLDGKLNILLDAGAEKDTYASDITRTFPINGKFTPESRNIYAIVLKMQKDSIALIKAGMRWDDVHSNAHRVLIQGLLDIGILRNGSVDDIFAARTSTAFMPHGLGHYLGMDTHDTGGHPDYADKDPMFRYLRIRGTVPAGAVVTVEPGCYFFRYIVEPYVRDPVHGKYIDAAVLDRYWDVGGVRIEDDVLVTESGHDNLTSTPKEIEEIERIIQDA